MRSTVFTALFMLGAVYIFAQNEMAQRGSIPEELLRPRREEAPRYPIDTVIGVLGQGTAPQAAYDTAKKSAAALLAGTVDTPVLSPANKAFLEDCSAKLSEINPRSYRLGGGREEPDGSYSFLVRFVGREQGITGELFVRADESRVQPRPQPQPSAPLPESEILLTDGDNPAEINSDEELAAGRIMAQVPPVNAPVEKIWLFEDLILEESRSREAENQDSRHRFDFPPYERFF
ncbi:MAG: hypothetical protein LBG95_06665 [Treponema sp.]|nr:hypothetical protein [Treponema sp.]